MEVAKLIITMFDVLAIVIFGIMGIVTEDRNEKITAICIITFVAVNIMAIWR